MEGLFARFEEEDDVRWVYAGVREVREVRLR